MYISNACVFPSDWTTENFMKTHNSRPYNPDLANTFFRAGYIESWGRGIQKIYEECDLIGAKIPEYSILGDDITECPKRKEREYKGFRAYNSSNGHFIEALGHCGHSGGSFWACTASGGCKICTSVS